MSEETSEQGESQQEPAAPGTATFAPEDVRSTPEYQALLKQNRSLARQQGQTQQQLAKARQEAEQARLAAEAQAQAASEQQLVALLGEEGVQFWDRFAELSATDQVGAATLLKEFMAKAQSPSGTPEAGAAAPPVAPEAPRVEPTRSTPPPPRGLDASAPLAPTSTGPDYDAIAADLEKTYSEVVERNQNMATRNRVTMRDRGTAFISYLGAAYLKAGARPKQ